MKTTFTKVPTGWRWEIDDDDATFSGVRPTKVEAHAEALACWSGVLYAEVNGDSPAPEPQPDWRARAEAAEQRAEALEAGVARLWADCVILGGELSEANRLLISGIPQQRGAAAERAAIAHTLKARAKTLRDRKALGAAEEVEALAFYVEQRGEVAEAQPAEVPNG